MNEITEAYLEVQYCLADLDTEQNRPVDKRIIKNIGEAMLADRGRVE